MAGLRITAVPRVIGLYGGTLRWVDGTATTARSQYDSLVVAVSNVLESL